MKIKIITAITILFFLAPAGYCSATSSEKEIKKEAETFICYGDELFEKTAFNHEKDIIEKTANIHNPDQTDEWHTAYYDGVAAKFYRITSTHKDVLRQIKVTDKKINMPFGIAIGTKKAAILQKLGTPSKDSEKELYYNLPSESYEESVTFRLSGDNLIEVQWDYEID